MSNEHSTSSGIQLPEPIRRLDELAYNLRWTWDTPTRELFASLDPDGSDANTVNPVRVLRQLTTEQIDNLAGDDQFKTRVNDILLAFDTELSPTSTWFDGQTTGDVRPMIAYFSAEFGLSETLPIYSGGLGVLAGDHLKSASSLGLPLAAVGLFYYDGYFQQSLDTVGWQQDADMNNDPHEMPVLLVRDESGEPLTISVEYPDGTVRAQIWKAVVGRIPLYLLDTHLPENDDKYRVISDRLYGGDLETRISQEIMLGIGGYRALEALGLTPNVYHMNEGHSAFLALERIRRLMATKGLSFTEARNITVASTIFTTHTPVQAGHDYFSSAMMRVYFREFARELGLEWQEFMSLGRIDPNDMQSAFGLTILAMRMADARNGVSKLHGQVSREMWTSLWPQLEADEVPIGHVTNGVNMQTWIANDLGKLYDRNVTGKWRRSPTSIEDWDNICNISPAELWEIHNKHKRRFVETTRQRLDLQLTRRGAPETELEAAATALHPDALTVGFARRFTAYKRATLLFTDVERLRSIVGDPERPIQFVFSGKAHPRDDPGKVLIQRIANISTRPPFQGKILFLEDYDMAIARSMVQGVDVWLNNPIRPQEASGTSGMKAAANGVLNCSVLDGWWDEAWQEALERGMDIGWAITDDHDYPDQAARDHADAVRLYEVLEQEIIPAFYSRDDNGLPMGWINRMKDSIKLTAPTFSANRMVADYTTSYYLPAAGSPE